MTQLEDKIRDVLSDRSNRGDIDPHLAPRVSRRARRRQVWSMAVAGLAVTVLVIGVLGAISAVGTSDDHHAPASVAPSDRVTLPSASITYPDGWYLIEFPGSVLQLTNFDPAFTRPCFTGDAVHLPADGVLLAVDRSGDSGGGAWPVDLARDPAPSACRPGGDKDDLGPGEPEHWSATWNRADANAMIGAGATADDRAALFDAFASLDLGDAPLGDRLSPSLVLDALDTPSGPMVLTLDANEGGPGYLLSVSVDTVGGATSLDEDSTGAAATAALPTDWGAVVYGAVTADAARAELRSADGTVFPAWLVPLPPSLGLADRQVVWGTIDGPTDGPVSTNLFAADGHPLGGSMDRISGATGTTANADSTTIATGTDPQAGPWELTLERTTDGIGLGFAFTNSGGSGGCCLSPLHGADLLLDGVGVLSQETSNITAVGSQRLATVAYETPDGTLVDGDVYDMPPNDERISRVAVVLVPPHVSMQGTLIGYDAAGLEIGREPLGNLTGEPPGPTPEIDHVWTMLRKAREAVEMWGEAEAGGSLEGVSVDAMRAYVPEIDWTGSGAGTPVPGKIALRGAMPAGGDERTGPSGWTVVLVSPSEDGNGGIGTAYCIGVNLEDGGGVNFRYGTQDAATYADCHGGWNEG
jgi:hypothetical protein